VAGAGAPLKSVTEASRLESDCQADWFARAELAMRLEAPFGTHTSEPALGNVRTVGDPALGIERALQRQA